MVEDTRQSKPTPAPGAPLLDSSESASRPPRGARSVSAWAVRARTLTLAAVTAALAAAGVVGGAAIAVMEREASRAAAALAGVERGPTAPLRAALADRWLAAHAEEPPAFGGDPRYWDSLARLHLVAAGDPALAPHDLMVRLNAAEAAARRALAGQPSSHGPWSRIAAIDVARDGRLSAAGVHALEQAATAAPYRERLAAWRFEFMAPRWRELTPGLRAQATSDAGFLWARPNQWLYRGHVRRVLAGAPAAQTAIAPGLRGYDDIDADAARQSRR